MKKIILVAGGTGNLGGKIVKALLNRDAEVRILARSSSDDTKLEKFEKLGVKIFKVDMSNSEELTKACMDVSCVVSALQGLHDVIVDTQILLMNAVIAAGVPRFIPSDFSSDYTKLSAGENRNFDLRREFYKIIDSHSSSILATSIFNGAFAEILTYNIPILDSKKKMIGYWGDNPDWKLDFTTMDDTAAFTAEAALDAPQFINSIL